jgi:hypothetical protein
VKRWTVWQWTFALAVSVAAGAWVGAETEAWRGVATGVLVLGVYRWL